MPKAENFFDDQLSQEPIPANHRAVPAVTRAIAILRLLAASETPLGVNVIATKLQLVPSTCLHILRILVREELLCFEPEKKSYSLDAGILTLARAVLRPNSFGRLVQPALDSIADKFPVTVLAARLVSLEHIVVVATSGVEQVMRIHVEPGSRFPALMSATGRCVAAFGPYSEKEVERRFAKIRWEKPPTYKMWMEEVKRTRNRRYSVDLGAYMAGITVVAAPIVAVNGRMTHVVVAIGLSKQIERKGIDEIIEAVTALASRFSSAEEGELLVG